MCSRLFITKVIDHLKCFCDTLVIIIIGRILMVRQNWYMSSEKGSNPRIMHIVHFCTQQSHLFICCMDNKIFIITKLRSEEHTSELQSRGHLVCRLLLDQM